MASAGEVVTEIRADDTDFDRKMKGIDRRLEKAEQDARRSGRRRGTLIASGVAGAVAGSVAGAISSSSPVNSILQLLLNVVAAALLPIFVAMLPLIETVTDLVIKLSDTLSPAVRFLSEKLALLLEIASGQRMDEYGGRLLTGDPLRDSFLVAGTTSVRYLGAVAQGVLDPNRTVEENLAVATRDTREAAGTQIGWLADKASSAWDSTGEAFSGVGGWFG